MIIPNLRFHLYGLIIVLSVLIGMIYIYWCMRNEIKQNRQILLFYIMYISFAFIFGKLYTFLLYFEKSFWLAGLSAYGGLLGVVVGAIIFEYILPLNGTLIKYSVLSLPLVYGLTKIACFISGCCSGILYNGFLKVIYPSGLNVGQFPVQIVETIVFLFIFLFCHMYRNKKNIIYITLILISFFKFLLDFLRYDHMNVAITRNQYFSVILFVITIVCFIINGKTRKLSKVLPKV